MNTIHLADNIARLRREKKITQEQLAEFMGVTKASVSKWETRQTMPDVILLPRLASFFDITIDELLGYEPQLSKEQIQKIYLELAECFATEEFEKVMERCRGLVKQYYSCYEFLSQMVCLWLNHYMLPGGMRSTEILEEAEALCAHILANCKDIGLCSDVVMLRATVCLQMGRAQEVIEELEDICNPCRLTVQSAGLLIGAYLQAGDIEKANSFTQISMYLQLISLVSCATQYITIHQADLPVCEETLHRIECVAEAYQLEKIHFNSMAVLRYQMAIVYSLHDRKKEAIEQLKCFVMLTDQFLGGDEKHLCGDEYFDAVGEWFDRLTLGENAPRDKRIIYDSMMTAFDTPAFERLKAEEEYRKLKDLALKRGKRYEE